MKNATIEAIKGERDYQNERWGKDDETDPKPVAAYLTYIRHWLTRAEEEVTKGGDHTALPSVRKITALGTACMDVHGAPTREQEEAGRIG